MPRSAGLRRLHGGSTERLECLDSCSSLAAWLAEQPEHSEQRVNEIHTLHVLNHKPG